MRHRPRFRTVGPTVALACALLVAGCGADPPSDGASGTQQPATPEPGTEIPDDFPLSAGMGGPRDVIATSRTGTGLRDLELCGTSPLRGLGIRDRMVADNSGGESADTRELVLLGTPGEAALVARAFSDLVADCAEPDVSGGVETVTELRGSPFGATPATTLVQTYAVDGQPGTGATVIHVVPVGAALLVTSTYFTVGSSPSPAPEYGEGSLASLHAQADEVTETTGKIVRAMCVFTKTGC